MKLETLPIIYHGSAKNVLRVDKTDLGFRFLKNFSVFDVGKSEDEIPGKDEAVCACAVKSFEVAEDIGVPTHFVEQLDSVTIRVRGAQVITDRHLTQEDDNYVVPIEWIWRLFVAGSIDRAFRSGKKKPENYGLPAGQPPAVGTPFPFPVHMHTSKFEEVDREITTDEEVCRMAGITVKDMVEYWSMIDRLTGALGLAFANAGYGLLDGKMECLMATGRQKMIGDVFGTPDEDRPCPLGKLREGTVEHHSKEFIRQLFIGNGYYDKLEAARKEGSPNPPLPRLSEEMKDEIGRRYATLARAYAGVNIR